MREGFILHTVSRKGRPKTAFEQRPEGSERVPYGYWGKFIPAADSKSQVPEREASSASSVWSSEPGEQRGERMVIGVRGQETPSGAL